MAYKKKIIIANWKMNLDYKNSVKLALNFKKELVKSKSSNEIVIMPDFLSISFLANIFNSSALKIGAQDLAGHQLGAFTGEVALESLSQLKCKYVLIGHSERREYFSDNELVNAKLKNVLQNSKITPVLCLGESLQEKKKKQTLAVIKKQLNTALKNIDAELLHNRRILIAYEPVWSIGTGLVPDLVDIEKVHKFIYNYFNKNIVKDKIKLSVLYGGSVNLKNYQTFKKSDFIDGLLVGGASLNARDFIHIANNF